MQVKSYGDALRYLDSFIKPVVFARIRPEDAALKDPLDRMRVLLKLLGNPQDKFKSVQVSGTSGKGSTAYLISHILKTAGYKTGLTISPHLEKINERIQINGKQISDLEFTKLIASMIRIIEDMKGMEVGEPSYFEITMAMAFKYFAEQKVDIGVVEVGMEGKYDASNTLIPIIAVLTNIDLDHTELLGNTVKEIAKEAVEIIQSLPSKKEQFVVTGVKQPSVIKIVEEKCKKVGAELYKLGKDFNYKIKKVGPKETVFDLTFNNGRIIKLHKLNISLLGKYQVENATLAIEVVRQLRKMGFKVSHDHIKKALKTAFFPGRFEIIQPDTKILRYKDIKNKNIKSSNILISQYPNIQIILDGAHNPAKMKAFLTNLNKLFPKNKKIFVIAFKSNKDIKEMLAEIVKVADKIIATCFNLSMGYVSSGAMEASKIKDQISKIKNNKEVVAEEDSKRALQKAIEIATMEQHSNSTIIVVTGSLYLVGEIRNML